MFSQRKAKNLQKLVDNARPDLRTDEKVQAMIFAKVGRGRTMVGDLFADWCWIIASDQRILLFRASKVKLFELQGLACELPRGIRLGPPKTTSWRRPGWYELSLPVPPAGGRTTAGLPMQTGFTYWSQVRAADEAMTGQTGDRPEGVDPLV